MDDSLALPLLDDSLALPLLDDGPSSTTAAAVGAGASSSSSSSPPAASRLAQLDEATQRVGGGGGFEEKKESTLEPTTAGEVIFVVGAAAALASTASTNTTTPSKDMMLSNGGGGGGGGNLPSTPSSYRTAPQTPSDYGSAIRDSGSASGVLQEGTPTVTPEGDKEEGGGGDEEEEDDEELAAQLVPPPVPHRSPAAAAAETFLGGATAAAAAATTTRTRPNPVNLMMRVETAHSEISELDNADVASPAKAAPAPAPPANRQRSYSDSSLLYNRESQHERPQPDPMAMNDDYYPDDDDDDSSNDESSYFADPSNLPSPKSGRNQFAASTSSIHSTSSQQGGGQPLTPSHRGGGDYNRESDASLSLSDDSDDERLHPQLPPPQPQQPQQQQQQQRGGGGGVPEVYPHPIIRRMHSVSSLVSTSSQCSSEAEEEEELRDATAQPPRGRRSSREATPDGRRSPVLGDHPPNTAMLMMMGSPSNHPLPSPPTIWPLPMQQQQQPPMDQQQGQGQHHGGGGGDEYHLQHPQPHHWNEEWTRWAASQGYYSGLPPLGLGYNNQDESPLSKEDSALSKESTFTYSEDSESGVGHGSGGGGGGGGSYGGSVFTYLFGGSDKSDSKNAAGPNRSSAITPPSTTRTASGGGGNGVSDSYGYNRDESSSLSNRGNNLTGGGGGGGFVSTPQGSANQQLVGAPQHSQVKKTNSGGGGGGGLPDGDKNIKGAIAPQRRGNFKVYWQRWIMLIYMSVMNLLSDWTCYSVAPIAILTEEAFGRINAEQLVVVFLSANGIATACEPIILSRLGLRRTVLFGALLLMIGSIVKSGGMPPIIQADLEKGQGEWRVYVGFFLVGLSQPLYQCTPALLSASWFPERERTMATGVALNSNQLGIGFAFIFGTLLVETSDDIPGYFGLLSILSTITFLGALIQFDDAPPTPPSDTARVMRGTLEVGLPGIRSLFQSVRNLGSSRNVIGDGNGDGAPSNLHSNNREGGRPKSDSKKAGKSSKSGNTNSSSKRDSSGRRSRSSRKNHHGSTGASSSRRSGNTGGSTARRRAAAAGTKTSSRAPAANVLVDDEQDFHSLGSAAASPSPARYGSVSGDQQYFGGATPIDYHNSSFESLPFPAPSPMMPGPVGPPSASSSAPNNNEERDTESSQQADDSATPTSQPEDDPVYVQGPHAMNPYPAMQGYPFHQPVPQGGFQVPGGGYPPQGVPYGVVQDGEGGGMPYGYGYGMPHQGVQGGGYAPPPYQQPVWDPRFQQYVYLAGPSFPPHPLQQHSPMPMNPYYSFQNPPPPAYIRDYESANNVLPSPTEAIDVGAEPVLTLTPHHLDINIRDDQVLLSIRACMARPGFIQALVSFAVSGIVINTLSTFMDYLVRLNGAGREYTGIVGGSFQFGIMISSLIVGQFTDRTRAYYSVTVGLLVLGAFALAECGVNLDSDRGVELRWSLVIVALLVGPLQPVSTELGVDVVYPLSENTVLVIQQLFSNLLSAGFIPIFKAMKDIGVGSDEGTEQPEYTFSFYVLIVLHAAATVFFATFNGRYLRYEHELQKKAQHDEYEEWETAATAAAESNRGENNATSGDYGSTAQQPRQVYVNADGEFAGGGHEQQALIPPIV